MFLFTTWKILNTKTKNDRGKRNVTNYCTRNMGKNILKNVTKFEYMYNLDGEQSYRYKCHAMFNYKELQKLFFDNLEISPYFMQNVLKVN